MGDDLSPANPVDNGATQYRLVGLGLTGAAGVFGWAVGRKPYQGPLRGFMNFLGGASLALLAVPLVQLAGPILAQVGESLSSSSSGSFAVSQPDSGQATTTGGTGDSLPDPWADDESEAPPHR